MPHIDDIFPSRYLSVNELRGRAANVVIRSAVGGMLGLGQQAAPKIVRGA